jgi:3-isopropylmalate/(R)-2-methylmalate dehydratase large subunit
MGQTIAQKILARASGRESVEVGEIVNARVDRAMSHENAKLVSDTFKQIGVEKVWDPSRIVVLFDHRTPANTIKTAEGHKTVRTFVKGQGIPNFLDMREGICHQVMLELGFALPGELVVGTDSHTTTYGAVGALSTGIGATEMAGVWATGELWLRVPESHLVQVEGTLPPRVSPKDLILRFIGDVRADGADYASVEFTGSTISEMSVAGRMVLCNMSMEAGAKAGIVAPDRKVTAYLKGRARGPYAAVKADRDATYAQVRRYDASGLEPVVAAPHAVDNVHPVSKYAGLEVDQAVLGSCTNGRLEDLKAAAAVMGERPVHPNVRMLVIPASRREMLRAIKAGVISRFVKAGAVVLNPGCGPCLGAHQGILAKGERAIASTNRNFKGRMGDPESEVFLASPETVAASAVRGSITDPREVV